MQAFSGRQCGAKTEAALLSFGMLTSVLSLLNCFSRQLPASQLSQLTARGDGPGGTEELRKYPLLLSWGGDVRVLTQKCVYLSLGESITANCRKSRPFCVPLTKTSYCGGDVLGPGLSPHSATQCVVHGSKASIKGGFRGAGKWSRVGRNIWEEQCRDNHCRWDS